VAQEIQFEWDDENTEHLAAHKVTPAEFEFVLTHNPVDLGYEQIEAMKKQANKQTKRTVPTFKSEAEEAKWWYENRETHGKQLRAAVGSGEARVLTRDKLLKRIAASKKTPATVVALRIPEADLLLARKQAEQKGLPYQTYIKSILHEILVKRENRKAG
jgi:predicted DNA binding CopG/RHH family protein